MAKKRATGFGDRLRELRIAAGLTQAQLAERAQMHLGGLTKLEQGEREPAWGTVLDLAAALGVSTEAFAQEAAEHPEAGPGRPPKPAPAPAAAEPEKKATKRKGGKKT